MNLNLEPKEIEYIKKCIELSMEEGGIYHELSLDEERALFFKFGVVHPADRPKVDCFYGYTRPDSPPITITVHCKKSARWGPLFYIAGDEYLVDLERARELVREFPDSFFVKGDDLRWVALDLPD